MDYGLGFELSDALTVHRLYRASGLLLRKMYLVLIPLEYRVIY